MKAQRYLYATVLMAGVGLAACGGVDSEDGVSGVDGEARTAGLALTADTLGDTDVAGMAFRVTQCRTNTPVAAAKKDLEDLYLPGGIGVFENKPYDKDSKHLFSDHYFLLPAGCYNVVAQPLDKLGKPSKDCDSARKNRVRVEDGETREILLISQCKGPEKGGLDIIGSINHPPEIMDVEFVDSKFLNSCQGRNTVCVTVRDVDNDPIELEWAATQRGNFLGGIREVSRTTLQDGSVKVCGQVKTGPRGDYYYRLRAWDLAYDAKGALTRIEDLVSAQENKPVESRDEINFPIYAGMDCRGRSAVMLMAMNNNPGPANAGYAVPFIRQTAGWVNPLTLQNKPQVLYVKDDNHNNEHPGDDTFVQNALKAEFGAARVSSIIEPAGGLTPAMLSNYDIVWFANPGFPMDDPASYDTLVDYQSKGGGLVIQGDDMAGPALGGGRSMDAFSLLDYQNNGITTCGVTTNNNVGNNHTVTFTSEPISALNGSVMDLRGLSFSYGNDIDHTIRQAAGERVLAWARLQNQRCPQGFETPAAVAIDPVDLP